MAVAATIDIILAAKTGKMDAGFAKARLTLKSFEGAVAGLGTKLVGFAAAFFTINRAVSAFSETFDELESLARTSDALGITADRLAGIHLQAENSSVSIEEMDRALSRSALNTQRDGRSIDQRFRDAAERIANTESATEKLRLATKLFGKQGRELIPLLNEGAAGFDKAQEKAREFGLALTDIDMKNIQAMDDAIDEITAAWKGLERQIVAKSAPKITAAVKAMTDTLKDDTPFLTNLAKHLALQWSGVADKIQEANKRTQELNRITEEMAERAEQLIESIKSPADQWGEDFRELEELFDADLINVDQFDILAERAWKKFRDGIEARAKMNLPGDFLGIRGAIDRAFDSGGSVMRSVDDFFDRARDRFRDFLEAPELQDIGAPGAAERGSMEAFNVMADIQRQEQQTQLQQLALAKKQLEKLGEIAAKVGKFAAGLLPAPL